MRSSRKKGGRIYSITNKRGTRRYNASTYTGVNKSTATVTPTATVTGTATATVTPTVTATNWNTLYEYSTGLGGIPDNDPRATKYVTSKQKIKSQIIKDYTINPTTGNAFLRNFNPLNKSKYKNDNKEYFKDKTRATIIHEYLAKKSTKSPEEIKHKINLLIENAITSLNTISLSNKDHKEFIEYLKQKNDTVCNSQRSSVRSTVCDINKIISILNTITILNTRSTDNDLLTSINESLLSIIRIFNALKEFVASPRYKKFKITIIDDIDKLSKQLLDIQVALQNRIMESTRNNSNKSVKYSNKTIFFTKINDTFSRLIKNQMNGTQDGVLITIKNDFEELLK